MSRRAFARHYLQQQISARRAVMKGRRGLRRRPPKPPRTDALARRYFAALMPRLTFMHHLVTSRVLPRLPGISARVRAMHHDTIALKRDYPASKIALERSDDLTDDIEALFENLRIEFAAPFSDHDAQRTATAQAEAVDQFSAGYTREAFQAVLGVDPFMSEPWLEPMAAAFVKQNVSLISSVSDEYFDDIERMVMDTVRSGAATADLAAEIEARYDVTERRAAFIARDQVSKFNGDVTKARQKGLGVDGYVWRGTLDARERDSHRENEGKRFSWDDPPATGHPGEAYNCRCVGEPDFSGLLEQDDESI